MENGGTGESSAGVNNLPPTDMDTERAPPSVTFATVAAPQTPAVRKYVEIDCSPFFNCYKIPRTPTIVAAVEQQFKNDRSKRLVPRRQGIWVLETEDVSHYLGCDHLVLNGTNIANLSVKVFRIGEGGRATARYGITDDRENDLLITLYQADTINFREVSHDDLYQKITEMGIGSMKKGITQQMYKDSDIPNGNLFFVLTDIDKDRDIDRIPHAFVFLKPGGQLRMWLNFRGKKRKCFFCNEMHDVTHCPVKERVRLMEEERKQKLAGGNGQFGVKTYGDSTVRHFCQKALASDVDAMSGGTTGNILNATEVDEENMGIQNIVIVAGQNEMNPRHSKEEFLWMLRKKLNA